MLIGKLNVNNNNYSVN